MDINVVKEKIIARSKLKIERDAMLKGFEDIKSNPMSAMTKMGDIEKLLDLTKKLEAASDELVGMMVTEIKSHEALPGA